MFWTRIGHVQNFGQMVLNMEMPVRKKRRSPQRRFIVVVKKEMKSAGVTEEDAGG